MSTKHNISLLRKVDISVILSTEPKDLIVLNRPNLSNLYRSLFPSASSIIWTDGAANHLISELGPELEAFKPTKLIGDMDSISQSLPAVLQETEILKIEDQNSTDLEKALKIAEGPTVVILTDFSGRLDHTLGAFSSILAYGQREKYVYLYSLNNFAFIISEPTIVDATGWKYCGLIPLCGRTKIFTEGLKWNLQGEDSEFGGLVSICNEFLGKARISSDLPVLFTVCRE